jgi:hypothetical protein
VTNLQSGSFKTNIDKRLLEWFQKVKSENQSLKLLFRVTLGKGPQLDIFVGRPSTPTTAKPAVQPRATGIKRDPASLKETQLAGKANHNLSLR